MAPPKVTHLVQRLQIQSRRTRLPDCVAAEIDGFGARFHPFKEFAVVARAVGAEVVEDVREGRGGHGD